MERKRVKKAAFTVAAVAALAGGTGSGIRTVLGVLLIILLSNCMNMLGVSTYPQTIM